jgi:hypothetical protein
MRDIIDFYFDGFVLSVDALTYLIRIRKADHEPYEFHRPEDLPEWVFGSKLAIWLLEEEAPMLQRSLEGDKIRNHLLSQRLSHVE